jgi:hypothetical protein
MILIDFKESRFSIYIQKKSKKMLNSEDHISHKRVEAFAKIKLQQLLPYGFSGRLFQSINKFFN